MRPDVANYIRTCPPCQKTKVYPARPSGLLQPNSIPTCPWMHILVDLITGLPRSQGYDSIAVVVDRFTKAGIFMPTNVELTVEGMARLYRNNVWKDHGLPLDVLSDRGLQSAS